MTSPGPARAPQPPSGQPLPDGTVGVYEDASPWTGARRVHFRGVRSVARWSRELDPTLSALPQGVPYVRAWVLSGEIEGLVLGAPALWWRLGLALLAAGLAFALGASGSLVGAMLVLAAWWWVGLRLAPRWRMTEEGIWLATPQGPTGWHLVDALWLQPGGGTSRAWLHTRDGWYQLQVRSEWVEPLLELAWRRGGVRPSQGTMPVRASLARLALLGASVAWAAALAALVVRGLAPADAPQWAPGVLGASLAVGLLCATAWSVAMRRTGQALWWLTSWGALALAAWMLYWRA